MTTSNARPTPAQVELAKNIFVAAAAAGIAKQSAGVDYRAMADESFKAVAAFTAAEKEAKPPINFGGAL